MRRKIFFKKFKKKNIFFFLIIFLLTIFIIFFYSNYQKKDIFRIEAFNKKFYEIPLDKGGKKIDNQNKKGLHLSLKNSEISINDNSDLNYSIQIFTTDQYNLVEQYREKLLSYEDTIFRSEDLFIAILNTNLGSEYFLLYKNFKSHLSASNHCEKYAKFIDNCAIVNVKILE